MLFDCCYVIMMVDRFLCWFCGTVFKIAVNFFDLSDYKVVSANLSFKPEACHAPCGHS